MDEKKPRTKQERRQRQRRLERAMKSPKQSDQPPETQPSHAAACQEQAPAKQPGRQKRPQITEADVQGLKYFDKLAPLLQRLHDEGCERDTANNRTLHYDQYCMLMLLYLFSPMLTSLRGIQQASELEKVQRKLGCQRTSLGSLSEATSVFDAQSLKEIIAELGDQLQPLAQDKRLTDIQQAITLVDGTLIAALPGIIEASWRKADCGNGMVKWRLHTHFELLRGVPTRIDVTPKRRHYRTFRT